MNFQDLMKMTSPLCQMSAQAELQRQQALSQLKLQAEQELYTFRILEMDDSSIQRLTELMQSLSLWERQKMSDVLTLLCLLHQETLTLLSLIGHSKTCRQCHMYTHRTYATHECCGHGAAGQMMSSSQMRRRNASLIALRRWAPSTPRRFL